MATQQECAAAIRQLDYLVAEARRAANNTGSEHDKSVSMKWAENADISVRTILQHASNAAVPDKRTTGVYNKFTVTRNDGKSAPGQKHNGCRYFVLDIDHDPHAGPALEAYAKSCAFAYPALSRDVADMARAAPVPPSEAKAVDVDMPDELFLWAEGEKYRVFWKFTPKQKATGGQVLYRRADVADKEEDEAYEIGKRDGYEEAVQDIDVLTGGDGEYFASTVPGHGCPDPEAMKARIAGRFLHPSPEPQPEKDKQP